MNVDKINTLFPDGDIALSQYVEISQDSEKMKDLMEQIKKRHEEDPLMKKRKEEREALRATLYPGAKDKVNMPPTFIQVPDNQALLLTARPTKETVSDYFKAVIEKRSPLLITLCSASETSKVVRFWKASVAKDVALPDGWKIEVVPQEKKIHAMANTAIIPEKRQKQFTNLSFAFF
jgi:hypothetical protein